MADQFSRVPYQAAEDQELTFGALRTLIALCKYCDEHFIAFPSQETLSKVVGISRKTVNKSIKLLEERGYIKKRLRRQKNSKRYQVSQYKINFTDEDILAARNASRVTSEGYTGHVTSRGYNSMGTPGVTVTAHFISPHTYQPTKKCFEGEEKLSDKPERLRRSSDAWQGGTERKQRSKSIGKDISRPNKKQIEMLHVIPGKKANQWDQRNKQENTSRLVRHCEGLGFDPSMVWGWLCEIGEDRADMFAKQLWNGKLTDAEILQSMRHSAVSGVGAYA